MNVGFQINDREFRAAMRRAEAAGVNFKPAFEVIGAHMVGSVQQNFAEGGRPQTWEPLADSSLLARAGKKAKTKKGTLTKRAQKRMAGAKPLIDKGMGGGLMGSITSRASRNSGEIGTNKIYARIHQEGGQAGRGHAAKIPARPYLLIQDEDETFVKETLLKHVARELL